MPAPETATRPISRSPPGFSQVNGRRAATAKTIALEFVRACCNGRPHPSNFARELLMSEVTKPRPKIYNLNLSDLMSYRLPLAGWVSILHRASGFLLTLLLPVVIWLFDKSVSSEISFGVFSAAFSSGIGIFAVWFLKLVVWVIITAFIFHALAGIRHLILDVTHRMTKEYGRHSAATVIVATIVLSLIFGAKLIGLY
jgi:succinate dehydrogenase / fumarate reductase cytochrome b subunit